GDYLAAGGAIMPTTCGDVSRPPTGAIARPLTINPGEIMGQTGSCLLDLGHPGQAAEAFADARNAFSTDEIRTRAQFLSRAATAQMRAGDIDSGSAIGHEVLALVVGVRSARLDDNLATMLTEARRYSSTAPARELLERGQTVMEERAA
ncbi:hypothetical protein ACWCYH_02160, partial [Streptomyces coelicoflavus]